MLQDSFVELQQRYAAFLQSCPVTFCGLDAAGTSPGFGGGRPYMLDVVGLNIQLINHTFESFQLDKQINVEALVNVSMPTEDISQALILQMARPLVSYTGQVCSLYSRSECMLAAVKVRRWCWDAWTGWLPEPCCCCFLDARRCFD